MENNSNHFLIFPSTTLIFNFLDSNFLAHKTKNAILTKKGLNISKKETEESLEITIIPGYYQDHYNVATNIKKFFSSLEPMIALRHNELPKKAIRTRMFDDLGSHEFYFDSLEGKFVTEKIKNNIDSKEYRL